ncbi:MAG: ribokinase [Clostridia bacterium]|nr:ribokinase [Clostridia bacterium]
MKRILVVSSANMDMVMNVDFVPVGGQTVIDKGSYSYVPGGKGANSAVAFSRLGAKCVFLTKLGKDANGDALLSLYEKEGMDVSYIKRDPTVASGLAAILVEKTGQNRIIVFPGANSKIELDTVSEAIKSKPDALYMQFEINYDAIIHAANEASKAGIPIFIDAGPANKDFPLDKLPVVTVFSPNESETEAFTGIAPTSEEKCKEAALKLLDLVKAKYIVIKLGGRGAYIFDGVNGVIKAPYDMPVVDTTAAGDAFTAALTLEYLRSGDMMGACDFANAAGSITVSRHGASSSIPNEAEVTEFLNLRRENK